MVRSKIPTAESIHADRERVERELHEERERLRITLASIGDAVVSTDKEGRVVFLNRVAETLTGWSQAEAEGNPLDVVMRLINEHTRAPVENPAVAALARGDVVSLANHTLLVSRDGVERAIEDSAAPMRDTLGTATLGAVLVFRDVSEKKKTEEARARLAAIVESSDDAIVSKTLDGIIRSWNAAAERLFGWTREEAVGRPITLIIPEEHIPEEREILSRLRRGERIEHFETVRVAKDGRRLDISLSVSPVRDREGTIIGASKIARDITERKRAAEALRASEERSRFLADLAAATQALADPEAVVSTTLRMVAEHLHADRTIYAEVDEAAVLVITGEHSRGVPSMLRRWPAGAFGPEFERCMCGNQPFASDDVEADPRMGSDLEGFRRLGVRALICVPLHEDGRLEAALAVHQREPRKWSPADLELARTVVARSWESIERTRVTRGLKDTADRLSLAMAAAALGDWSWDHDTDVVTFSDRAAEIFGIAPGPHMTWTRMLELIHPDDRERARRAVQEAVASHTQYDVEYRVRRPDGREVWVSAKGRAQYRGGRALGMFGVLQDFTERKRLEQELERRAEELAESDRKKDDFIALLAHELRNPLAPVRNGLQVMRLAAGDAKAVSRARAMMDRQLGHMVRLIDDLLDVSRMNRNKLNLQRSRVSLAEVVSHAVEAAGPAIESAGHLLSVSLPERAVALDADLTRLAQVFGNLLMNSAKYTDPGGRIALDASVVDGEVVIEVRDNGIGIPAEALPRVFDMFSQVERSDQRDTGGLGIGLALVKGLVEMHGGSVTAESRGPGTGSTFRVKLPVADTGGASARGDLTATGPHRVRQARRVLVVDDNRDAAESMADMLRLMGNEVHTAHDGVEALEAAERLHPDVVLMDVGMPRLNGLEATRRIREQSWSAGIKIIALTGWGQNSDRERSQSAGCDGHLVKPVSLAELEKVLAAR